MTSRSEGREGSHYCVTDVGEEGLSNVTSHTSRLWVGAMDWTGKFMLPTRCM